MDSINQKAAVFYAMLTNAYRDDEEWVYPEKLQLLSGADLTEDITAVMLALNHFAGKLLPNTVGKMDLIDFTHMLNKLAIQYAFAGSENLVDDSETKENE